MSLTRKMLKAMSLEADVIDQIIEAHTESLDGVKKERDDALANAAKLAEVQAQLDKANKRVAELEKNGGDAAKVQAAFDAYKAEVETEKQNGVKREALNTLLRDCGITRDSYRELVAKSFDLTKMEVDEKGKFVGEAELKKTVTADYKDFISTTTTVGTPKNEPPAGNGGGKMTKAEILAIKDTGERQKAIAENLDLFRPGLS